MINCIQMEANAQNEEVALRFHEAIRQAWQKHTLGNPTQASFKINKNWGRVRISAATLRRMHDSPYLPDYEKVIAWAEGLGEDINRWLELAGYDPIPEELVVREDRSEYRTAEEAARFIRDRVESQGGPHLSDAAIDIILELAEKLAKKRGGEKQASTV